ncbi:Hypothetical protein NTJ_02728 [Nesidiocoris tenuis]|uniref:acylphosphatase n=1 Tax=Nesidiocoris tenuis TaxID=355587 RepID=A0ABN7AC98_9HEMI|nr:Hypothetical protein NTJ_02728 [Nesidiocoris tenuis]
MDTISVPQTKPLDTIPLQRIASLRFEVSGRVQGVHFRRYMKFHAMKLDIRGYVSHSPTGSVVGVIQGSLESIIMMKRWLTEIGSPDSHIERVKFEEEEMIDEYSFDEFTVR